MHTKYYDHWMCDWAFVATDGQICYFGHPVTVEKIEFSYNKRIPGDKFNLHIYTKYYDHWMHGSVIMTSDGKTSIILIIS